MITRRVRRLLWVLAVCVLGVLGLRTFVFDLYRVSSSSMVPSIWPDEVVLVAYDRSRPTRLESVVVERQDEYVVKRAAGIGGDTGEDLLIDGSGDLRIGGTYLPPDVPRHRVLVFDQGRQAIEKHFARGSSTGDPWLQLPGGVLELDARQVERGREAGLLRYHTKLADHYLNRAGELIEGSNSVHDAAVEFEVRLLDPGGLLRVGLVEEGDTFWFVIEQGAHGLHASIVRDDGSQLHALVEIPVDLPTGLWRRVTFSNIDNHLTAQLEGATMLEADYERNTPHPGDHLAQGLSLGERVKLGGEGCHLELRGLRLWRDLHYTARGQYGVGTRCSIGPSQLFLLGDNSDESLDSREYGAIDEGLVVGRPVMVVWPPSAIRWLR